MTYTQFFRLLDADSARVQEFMQEQDAKAEQLMPKGNVYLNYLNYRFTFYQAAAGHSLCVSNLVTGAILSLPAAQRAVEGSSTLLCDFGLRVPMETLKNWLSTAGASNSAENLFFVFTSDLDTFTAAVHLPSGQSLTVEPAINGI